MLAYTNETTSTFFDLTAMQDTAAMDRLNSIRELHERLTSKIRDQQLAVEAAQARVYR